ncbi:hypothetical protein D3C85_917070 [compost metagenome]
MHISSIYMRTNPSPLPITNGLAAWQVIILLISMQFIGLEQIHDEPVPVLYKQYFARVNNRIIVPGVAIVTGKPIVVLIFTTHIPNFASRCRRRLPMQTSDVLILPVHNNRVMRSRGHGIFPLFVPLEEAHTRVRQQLFAASIHDHAQRIGMRMSVNPNARTHPHIQRILLPILP